MSAIDPFAAAARAFDRLTAELADPASAALAHHDLEADRGAGPRATADPPQGSGPSASRGNAPAARRSG
ncbi:hypothetical protein ACWGIY_32395, partial [Streptomyces sp. NPDC054878]